LVCGAGTQTIPELLLEKRTSRLERPVRDAERQWSISGGWLITTQCVQQDRTVECEAAAVIASGHEMADTVAFIPIEKQDMIGIGNDAPRADVTHENTSAWENNGMVLGLFLRSTGAFPRPAAHIRDRDGGAPVENVRKQVFSHATKLRPRDLLVSYTTVNKDVVSSP